MAIYTINFSSNASSVVKDLQAINKAIANTAGLGKSIKLQLDTSNFDQSINSSFKKLDKNISQLQRKLNKISIGSESFGALARRLGEVEGLKSRGQMQAGVERLRGQASVFEGGSEAAMSRMLQALQTEASMIKPNTQEWVSLQQQIGGINGQMQRTAETARSIQLRESLGAFAPGSLARLESQLTILRNRAREIAPNTDEWRKLNKEILNTEKAIQKVSRRPLSTGRRMGAAGGAFLYGGGMGGGAGSALAGVAGGLMGGEPGAFAGAAIGQLTDNVIQGLGAIASYTAEIDKQRIALRNVVGDANEYEAALAFISETSRALAIPQDILNREFTRLSASVIGAGGNVSAAEEAFLGISAGIRGTGGSLRDLEGALLATSQVFSKGKVSAEELRRQIGERLPGAFTLFASSMEKTPQELDKMLQLGQVGLNDFMAFVRKLSEEYGATAEEIAASTQGAGDRVLTIASELREEFGRALQPVGAAFQETLAKFLQENQSRIVDFSKAIAGLGVGILAVTQFFIDLLEFVRSFAGSSIAAVQGFTKSILGDFDKIREKIASVLNFIGNLWQQTFTAVGNFVRQAFTSIGINLEDLRKAFDSFAIGFQSMWGQAFDFIAGKWKDTVRNMINYSNPIAMLLKGAGVDVGEAVVQGIVAAGQAGGPSAPTTQAARRTSSAFGGFPGELGDGAGGKGSKLASFFNDQAQFLRNQLQIKLQILQADRDLNEISETALRTESALLTLDYQRKIIAEQLRIALARLAEENLSSGDKLLKSAQLRAEAEQELVIAANDAAKAGRDARQALKDIFDIKELEVELEEQQELLAAVGMGLSDLTDDMKVYFQVRRLALGKDQEEIAVIAKEIEAYKKLQEQILKTTKAIAEEREMKSLRERAELATIFNPTERRRRELQIGGLGGEDLAKRLTQEIETERLERLGEQLRGIASSIGDAFGNAFRGIITGSSSVREALAGLFSSIADSFANMVGEIISQWMRTQVLQGLGNIFGSLGGSLGGGVAAGIGASAGGMGSFGFNPGAMTGGIPFTPFANGGIVKGPTLGLVGEGRYNEAVVPLPDGRKIPVDLGGSSGGDIATSIVVNVSNGQSSSETSGTQGNQLARELEGAVKQVILKETRPGGIIFSQR